MTDTDGTSPAYRASDSPAYDSGGSALNAYMSPGFGASSPGFGAAASPMYSPTSPSTCPAAAACGVGARHVGCRGRNTDAAPRAAVVTFMSWGVLRLALHLLRATMTHVFLCLLVCCVCCADYSPTSPGTLLLWHTNHMTSRIFVLFSSWADVRSALLSLACVSVAAYSPTSPAYSPTSPGTHNEWSTPHSLLSVVVVVLPRC